MSRPIALSHARDALAVLQASGEVYTRQQHFEATLALCQGLASSALEGLVAGACDLADKESVQKRRRASAAKGQRTMFDLEGSYALGDNERIAKRAARREHMLQALHLSDANLDAVLAANHELHDEFDRLDPYLRGPDVRKEDAARRYLEDHPQSA